MDAVFYTVWAPERPWHGTTGCYWPERGEWRRAFVALLTVWYRAILREVER